VTRGALVCCVWLAAGCVDQLVLRPSDGAMDGALDAGDAPAPLADGAPAEAPDAAPREDAPPPVCGNGRREPGETCETCGIDLAGVPEVANNEDDNCDGRVDEHTRTRLARLHCDRLSRACSNPTSDWDHCFSTEPSTLKCFNDPDPSSLGSACRADGYDLYIHALSLGEGSPIPWGGGELYRLWDCYSPSNTQHVYVIEHDAMQHRSWGYRCVPIGYVPLGPWPRDRTRRVYAHNMQALTTRFYDFEPVSGECARSCATPQSMACAGRCDVCDENPLWWAWETR